MQGEMAGEAGAGNAGVPVGVPGSGPEGVERRGSVAELWDELLAVRAEVNGLRVALEQARAEFRQARGEDGAFRSMRCEGCFYWKHEAEFMRGQGGFCCFNPPSVQWVKGKPCSAMPFVFRDSWCGRWLSAAKAQVKRDG